MEWQTILSLIMWCKTLIVIFSGICFASAIGSVYFKYKGAQR